ncbi:hypothetical protein [Salinimicrobium xinjiangense]|uniref:hypothetical protein n=1 Tax=Salinimicrobium xinjiangense TaxID=438596 RepID=UPI00041340FD|nr:hypothetical protein [Salinimicrobium xinjiangense]
MLPLAKTLNAAIEIVHITHKDEDQSIEKLNTFRNKVQSEIDYSSINFKTLYSFEIVDTLRKAIEEDQPDIVLMPERKKTNIFKRGLVRDRIKKMQTCSPSPLLSYPALS